MSRIWVPAHATKRGRVRGYWRTQRGRRGPTFQRGGTRKTGKRTQYGQGSIDRGGVGQRRRTTAMRRARMARFNRGQVGGLHPAGGGMTSAMRQIHRAGSARHRPASQANRRSVSRSDPRSRTIEEAMRKSRRSLNAKVRRRKARRSRTRRKR